MSDYEQGHVAGDAARFERCKQDIQRALGRPAPDGGPHDEWGKLVAETRALAESRAYVPKPPEVVEADHAAYFRGIAERMVRHAALRALPENAGRLRVADAENAWEALTDVERDEATWAAEGAVLAVMSELHNAVDGAVWRSDSPLAPLTQRVGAWRWREMGDEHYARTQRAGVVAQPAPVPVDPKGRETWHVVVRDFEARLPDDAARHLLVSDARERHRLGVHRYRMALGPHNGRNSLVDAYQEALDKVVYLRNALLELEDAADTGLGDDPRYAPVEEEYGEAVLAAYRLRCLVGTTDRFGAADEPG